MADRKKTADNGATAGAGASAPAMMQPPPAERAAQQEAETLRRNPHALDRKWQRALDDGPPVDEQALLEGLLAFHQQRMACIPPETDYPESPPWVRYVIEVDRQLQQATGMSDRQMAVHRSLRDYLAFRGFGEASQASAEKCRVAWVPDTDRGPLHIKNVDDPMPPNWPPARPVYLTMPHAGALVWDGVGSGLHLDDEPAQIFPLPIRTMCQRGCGTVREARAFLERYSCFWARQNVVLHDQHGDALAIEKASFNHMACHEPDATGRVWVSGMVSRDPESALARHVAEKRRAYLSQFNLPDDGPDALFWQTADALEAKLSEFLSRPGPLASRDVFDLFLKTWPDGLNKDGRKSHPDQPATQYTLVTHGTLLEEGVTYRYERDAQARTMPNEPEVFVWDPATGEPPTHQPADGRTTGNQRHEDRAAEA